MTEQQIFEAIRMGGVVSDKACEFMYKNWYQQLACVVTKHQGTNEQAREVIGETLIRLIKRIKNPHFQLENATLLTYTYTIAKNVSYRKFMANKKNIPVENLDFVLNRESPDDTPLIETLEEVNNALAKLGEPCKSILTYTGLGYADLEIADLLGYVKQSITNRKSKCRKLLINLMGDYNLY